MPSIVNKKEMTRKNIIDSAIKALNDKEYHECLIDIIAKNAGIGKGTIYLYFKSKQELYYSILIELLSEAKTIVDSAKKDHNNPGSQLRTLLEKMSEFMDSHGNAIIIAKAETGNVKGKMQVMTTDVYGGLLEQIGTIFQDGADKQLFKRYPPVFMGALIMSSLLTTAKYKHMNRPEACLVTPDLLADIFINGINKEI
jgi:AcrR family transcriptional regulator